MINLDKLPLPREPYRGIEPFRLIDGPIFLQRTEAAERLGNLLSLYRGVLLYGESGAGKSSLLNAGLLPQMLRRGRWPERIRVQPKAGSELYIERIALREEPQAEHAAELVPEDHGLPHFLPTHFSEVDSEERIELSCTAFFERLARGGDMVPLLIFDQFEELVTLFEEAPSNRERFEEAQRARAAIVDLIGKLLLNDTPSLKVIFAFRDDYLGKLTPYFLTVPNLTDQFVRLNLPTTSSLLQIVHGPFGMTIEHGRQIGLPGHFKDEFDELLVEKIVAGLNERSPSGLVNLSEAQSLCQILWQKPALREQLRTAASAPPGTFQSTLSLELARARGSVLAALGFASRRYWRFFDRQWSFLARRRMAPREQLPAAPSTPPRNFWSALSLALARAGSSMLSTVDFTLRGVFHFFGRHLLFSGRQQPGLVKSCGQVIDDILGEYTAAAMEKLPRPLLIPAMAVLSNLVTSRGTRNVVSEDDLLKGVSRDEKVKPEIAQQAVDELQKKTGLVRQQLRSGTNYFEITSEFVIPWIYDMKAFFQMRRVMRNFAYGYFALIAVNLLAIWIVDQKREAQFQKTLATEKNSDARAANELADQKSMLAEERLVAVETAKKQLADTIVALDVRNKEAIERQKTFEERERYFEETIKGVALFARKNNDPALMDLLPAREQPPVTQPTADNRKPLVLPHDGDVWMAAFFGNGSQLVTACADKNVRFWNLDASVGAPDRAPVQTWKGTPWPGGVTCVAVDHTARYAVSASAGRSLRVYSLMSKRELAAYDVHTDTVTWIAFESRGSHFISTSADRTAILWSMPTQDSAVPTHAVPWKHHGVVSFASFSADGQFVATSCDDGFIRRWEVANPTAAPKELATGAPIRRAIFSEALGDERILVPTGKRLLLWSGEKPGEFPFEYAVIHGVFSPDGTRVAVATAEGKCRLINIEARQLTPLATQQTGRILRLAWSSTNLLAIAGEDGSVELWNVAPNIDAILIRRWQAHEGPVWWVVFSPDGKRLVTTSAFSEENLPSAKGAAAQTGGRLKRLPDNTARVWPLD